MKKRQLRVRHLSKEDIREYEGKFPLVLDWAVIDAENGTVIDFFDTEEEAQAVLDDLNQASMIGDSFRDWVRKTAKEAGVEQQNVLDIVRGELGEWK